MHEGDLDVSVVMATRDRARRLERALAALRAQTLPSTRFEVVVVDDASADGTRSVLAAEAARGELRVRAIRRAASDGPAAARNEGWRAARAPLIAFTDDDCVPEPEWLEAGLKAWAGRPDRIIQGTTKPIEGELDRLGRCAYTMEVRELAPEFPTCNMFYPRALLERLGGFDEVFPYPIAEDTDLAWRAIEAGARPVFVLGASVQHAVVSLSPAGFLRRSWMWGHAMLAFARHPGLRRSRLIRGLFWNHSHWLLARVAVALVLPRWRALWPLKLWLGYPYVQFRLRHYLHPQPSLITLLWFLLVDSVEVLGVIRGALRYRTLVL